MHGINALECVSSLIKDFLLGEINNDGSFIELNYLI